MNKNGHLSEEEIQDYIENYLDSDKVSVSEYEHLKNCKKCSATVQAYKTVWSFIEDDYRVGNLEIDLTKAVTNKLFNEKNGLSVLELVLNSLGILMVLIGMVLCIHYLITGYNQIGMIAFLFIPMILYFLLAGKEIKVLQGKFFTD